MPTYQYACTECDNRFEAVQSFSDPSLTACPVCAGKLRKVYGSVGVVFKGTGFYRNDSRGDGAPKAPKAPAKEGASTGGDSAKSESTKSESTSAASSSSSSGSGSDSGSSSSKTAAGSKKSESSSSKSSSSSSAAAS